VEVYLEMSSLRLFYCWQPKGMPFLVMAQAAFSTNHSCVFSIHGNLRSFCDHDAGIGRQAFFVRMS